jgi:hypothetical protein
LGDILGSRNKRHELLNRLVKTQGLAVVLIVLAGGSGLLRYCGGMPPDNHVLPKWLPLAAAAACLVYLVYVSFLIRGLRRELGQPAATGRKVSLSWPRAVFHRLWATRRARYLTVTVIGALVLLGSLAAYRAVVAYSFLTYCESPWGKGAQRAPAFMHNRCLQLAKSKFWGCSARFGQSSRARGR